MERHKRNAFKIISERGYKSKLRKIAAFLLITLGYCGSAYAQQPIGTPPIGGPGPIINVPGSDVYNPGPPPPEPAPLVGNGPLRPMVVSTPLSSPNWQNSGTITVIACGTDAQSVWRTIPLRVSYSYNGAQYDVTVDSAWNPWTDTWNYNIDIPAFNTYYFLNGNYYDFYVNLSTGTFYFNL